MREPAALGWAAVAEPRACVFQLPWPDQFGRVERLQRVDFLRGLSLYVPFELPQHHLVRREVDDGEAVLLDRLDLLVHVEMDRRKRSGPASPGWPAEGPRADRARKDGGDRVLREIETAAAQHPAD